MNIKHDATYSMVAGAAKTALAPEYGAGEAAMMVRIIFEQLKGYSPTDMIVNGNKPCSEFIQTEVSKVVDRLLADEPIQYIFGTARFYGLNFKVTPDVLIPRPETEELVDLIVKRYADISDLSLLDVCTGSGCIAVSLARALKFAQVTATDISEAVLDVARENARNLKVKVNFLNSNALSMTPPSAPVYDIIVSNPPYIAESEQASMHDNVLLHEPHTALFVPDSNPLLFYKAIAAYAAKALKPGGTLWFEINPLFASQMHTLLSDDGFENISITADAQGRQRFACAVKPSW